MAHTHEFDCPVCGAHLDSRNDLVQHARKEHSHSASSGSQSGQSQSGQSKRTDVEGSTPRPT
jgi:uncharacterized C2H2 Zn-finger protein